MIGASDRECARTTGRLPARSRRLVLSSALFVGTLFPGGQLAVAARGQVRPPPASPAPVCVAQGPAQRMPGVVLAGPRLHGLAMDETTGHTFVLSSGTYDVHGRYTCVTAVTMLDTRTGTVLRRTPISLGTGPSSYRSLAIHAASHRVLAMESGNVNPPGPVRPGSLNVLDTRTGRLLKSVNVGPHPGDIAVDQATYRAFIPVGYNTGPAGVTIAVLAITRGQVLRTVHDNQTLSAMTVDQSANRVFLISDQQVMTLDGATGKTVGIAALPTGFHQFNGYSLDERTGRLFVAQVGLAPPHSDRLGNPPNTLSMIDSRTGTLIRSLEAGPNFQAGQVVADPVVGRVLSWTSDDHGTRATVLDSRDGTVLRSVTWKGAAAAAYGPTAVDSRTGDIFTFTGGGIRRIRPGSWKQIRTVSARQGILSFDLQIDSRVGRVYALQWERAAGFAQDTVRAICTLSGCR